MQLSISYPSSLDGRSVGAVLRVRDAGAIRVTQLPSAFQRKSITTNVRRPGGGGIRNALSPQCLLLADCVNGLPHFLSRFRSAQLQSLMGGGSVVGRRKRDENHTVELVSR